MADLGNLFFSLGLKTDDIDKAWNKALAKYGKEAKIMLKFDTKEFTQQAEAQKLLHKQSMNDATLRTKAARDAIALREKEALMAEKIHTQEARTQAVRDRAANAIKNTNTALGTQHRLMQNLHTLAASYISIFAAGRLIRELVTVSGEFEMQRVSLQAILKDLEGANKIFDQIKKLSVQSPFQFKDLISYTKQLSAFSIPMGELYDTTKMLSDVSAGLGVGMDRLVLAYGQIRAASVLRGQEVRQLTEAGIPVIEELRKKFEELGETGITAADVFDKISARLVPFEMIKEMFVDLTSEGGKFYKMQEIQAETLKGKVSNLKDAYQIMFSEIGEKGDGVLKGVVDSTRWLISNYELVGKTIMELVATYGVYKASLIAITTYQRLYAAAVLYSAASSTSLNVAQLALSATTNALTAAQTRLNAAIMKNPYVLAAAAVAALGYGLYKMITYQNEAQKAQERLNDSFDESQKLLGKEIAQLDMLYGTLKAAKEGTIQYTKAKEAIEKQYAPYLKQLAEENGGVLNLVDAYELLRKKLIEVQQEKGYQKAIETALDAYSEGISKQAEKIGRQINKSTLSGLEKETLKASLMDVLWGKMEYKDIESGTKKLFESFTETVGSEKEGTKYVRNTLQPILDKASEINGAFKEVQKTAQTMFKSDGGLIGPVIDMSKVMLSSKAWVQSIEAFIKQQGIDGLGLGKRQEESPEDYIDRLREEYSTITTQLSLRSKLAGEDVEQLRSKLKNLTSIFGIIGVSPTEQKGGKADIEETKDVLADLVRKLELELSKVRVDAMEEGWRKEMAQEQYQHEKRLEQIEEHKRDLLAAQKKEKGSGTILTPENAAIIGGLTTAENTAYANKQKQSYQNLLDKYADFERKKQNLQKSFAEESLKLQGQWTKEGGDDIVRALKVLRENYDKEMKELMDSELNLIMQTSPLLIRIFTDTANLSRKTIKGMIADAKQLLKYISGDKSGGLPMGIKPEDANKMVGSYESIRRVQKEIMDMEADMASKRQYPFASFVNALDSIKMASKELAKITKDTTEEEKKNIQIRAEAFRTEGIKQFAAGLVEVGNTVNYVADSMAKLAEATNNVKLAETAEQMKGVANVITSAGQGASQGGWIGAIVGAALSMITQTIDAFTIAKAEVYEFEQNQIDFLNAYKNLLLTIKEEDYASVFGVRYLSMASDAAKNATKSVREYKDLLAKRTMPNMEKDYIAQGAAMFFGSAQGSIRRQTAESKLAFEAFKKGYSDIQRMAIKTKDQSGWANFFGAKDEFKTLFDLAPELWGGKLGGDFNVDAARAFLETNTQITDEQRKQIENLIRQKELYDENMSIIRKDIEDTFGGLGDAMTDAIVQSITTGADSFQIFEDAGISAIENLGKKLIMELFFAKKFKKLQEDMEGTYENGTPEDIANAQLALMEQFYSTIGTDMENAEEFGKQWRKKAEEAGFDIYRGESENNLGAGIKGVTEPTANLLSSYLNAVRADVAANRADFKGIVPVIGNINDLMGNSLAELQMISANTLRSANGVDKVVAKLDALTAVGGATKLNTRVVV